MALYDDIDLYGTNPRTNYNVTPTGTSYYTGQTPGMNPSVQQYVPGNIGFGAGSAGMAGATEGVPEERDGLSQGQLMGIMGGVGTAVDMYGNISSLAKADATASIPSQYYTNPYVQPQQFVTPENPYAKGVGAARALEYGGKGAMYGSMIAPGIGTAIGAGIGAIGGLVEGKINEGKRAEFEEGVRKEREAYEEAYGNYQSNIDKQRRELQQDLYNQRRMQSTYIPPNTLF